MLALLENSKIFAMYLSSLIFLIFYELIDFFRIWVFLGITYFFLKKSLSLTLIKSFVTRKYIGLIIIIIVILI